MTERTHIKQLDELKDALDESDYHFTSWEVYFVEDMQKRVISFEETTGTRATDDEVFTERQKCAIEEIYFRRIENAKGT